jgi:antitoxin component YwqK of YwqJK toxin-antitoxin module
MLVVGLAWGQTTNPCEDERYLKIKKKSLDKMSDREYAYFLKFDEKCTDYLESSSTYSGVKSKEPVVKPIDGETLIEKDDLISQQREEITEKHPNGMKKVILVYEGEGRNENIIERLEYYENGQIEKEETYKDGKEEGLTTYWYESGEKQFEIYFKNGKRDGLWTWWYENGQKNYEGTYKDGKEDGLWTNWYENGQKKGEGTYKDGKRDGLWTNWYENGQKKGEGTYKDGKEDGLWTWWHDNGQKDYEITYKNGEVAQDNQPPELCWMFLFIFNLINLVSII